MNRESPLRGGSHSRISAAPIAFGDESFAEHPTDGFYIIAVAVIEQAAAEQMRVHMRAMRRSLRGNRELQKLHWNALDDKQRREAAVTVGALPGLHLVAVGSPVPQRRQERARAMCLTQLVVELHALGVQHLVMEARENELNQRDVRTVQGARWRLPKNSVFRIEHRYGASEPNLWLPDVVAGASRVRRLGDSKPHESLRHLIREIRVATQL